MFFFLNYSPPGTVLLFLPQPLLLFTSFGVLTYLIIFLVFFSFCVLSAFSSYLLETCVLVYIQCLIVQKHFSPSLCFSTYQYYVNVIFFTSKQGTYFTFHFLTHPTSFQIRTLNHAFLILSFILRLCNISSFPTQFLFPSMQRNASFVSHSLSSSVVESRCTVV